MELPWHKITNVTIWYYCTASHRFMRESWLWHVLLPTGRLDSLFFRDALQNAKQLFSTRLSKITKYCIMRECENILRGYLYDGDLVFVILKGVSIFKFPKRFLEISSRDLTSSFLLQLIQRPDYQPNLQNWCPFPLHLHGSMPSKQSHILTGQCCCLFALEWAVVCAPFLPEVGVAGWPCMRSCRVRQVWLWLPKTWQIWLYGWCSKQHHCLRGPWCRMTWKKWPLAWLHAFGLLRYEMSLCAASTMLLAW